MSFNYRKEEYALNKRLEKQRRFFKENGMSDEQIAAVYVRSLLVEQLKKHTPQEILNSGKLDLTLTGRKRFIHQIYEIYNEGIECKENRLPILF